MRRKAIMAKWIKYWPPSQGLDVIPCCHLTAWQDTTISLSVSLSVKWKGPGTWESSSFPSAGPHSPLHQHNLSCNHEDKSH